MCFLRFSAAVPSWPSAAARELMAGSADDRAHLEIYPLPRKTHLCTGPYNRPVVKNTYLLCDMHLYNTFPSLYFYVFFFFRFLHPPLTLTRILRVIHPHFRFSISHLATPTYPPQSERLITCTPWRREPLTWNIHSSLHVWAGNHGRFNQSLNAMYDGNGRRTEEVVTRKEGKERGKE